MMSEQTFRVVYWQEHARYEDDWTEGTIRRTNDDDWCAIATVEGVPVDEWLSGRPTPQKAD